MLTTCAAAVLFSASVLVPAAAVSTNKAVAVPYATFSLAAAVAAAEKHVHGNAVRADYEKQKDGQWVYEIEVRSGPKVFDVKLDVEKGTVIATTEDNRDADDGDDEAD
ncbi:MAG: propeptide, PepSY amd peptidase [Bradyrhizobium sp.]|jgi:uncharacterized membrane protein YkoI|nr:propeptide, PepSY amd peptidase [Bradyrhizobium sp.]